MLSFIIQILSESLLGFACAVCGNLGDDPAAGAILAGTGLLSVAPILTIGGGIYYVYRKTRIDRGDGASLSDASGDVPPQESVLPASD